MKAAVCALKMSADHPVKNGAVPDQTEHDLRWRADGEKNPVCFTTATRFLLKAQAG